MKISILISFITLFTIACSKESNIKEQASSSSNIVVSADSPNTPINDLGKGIFNGYTGGLYPNGSNSPGGTYASDLLKVCRNIIPLDTFGNPSTTGNPLTNPKLSLVDISIGSGYGRLNDILSPDDPFWNTVTEKLKRSNSSFRQVQIVYLDTEDSSQVIGFPVRPLLVKNDLESCFRTLQQKFPNIKLVYLVARTTTYGKNHVHDFNAEPNPYYFGWAAKWAIEDQ